VFHSLKSLLCVICLLCLSIPGAQGATWPEYRNAGFRAFNVGDYRGALEQFESALILAYDQRAPAEDLGTILENLATVYFAIGRPQDAWGSVEQWDKLMAQSADESWVSEQKTIRDPLARLISETLDQTQGQTQGQTQVRTEPSRDADPGTVATIAPPTSGDYAIHLESAEIESNVQSSWDHLKAAYPAQFADKSLLVREVDLGDQGTFYRILAGPYAEASDADTVCRELEDFGQYCAVQSLQ
jgi:tetratricopeptide (TPR) repeat protein